MSPRPERVFSRSAIRNHKCLACFLVSEELLGVHDTVRRYYKYELAVPLRLLPFNSVKHRLARDVSQTPAAAR